MPTIWIANENNFKNHNSHKKNFTMKINNLCMLRTPKIIFKMLVNNFIFFLFSSHRFEQKVNSH